MSATSMLVEKDDPGLLHRAWRFRIKTSSLLAVPPMVLAFGIAPTLVPTLLSNSYRPAAAVLRVVLIGQTLISLLGGGAHADILLASGKHKLVRSMRITAAWASSSRSGLRCAGSTWPPVYRGGVKP